jgi:[acyl-carrier-protein] S-malonyltransferase
MAAIVGFTLDQVRDLCEESSAEGEPVDLANLNAPIQIVVSGHVRAVGRLMERAKERGAKLVVPLPISVPCHCRLLKDASELFKEDLEKVSFKSFRIPVIPNCDPSVFYSPENARDLLRRQIVSPVRWQETVEKIAGMGVDTILEIGPKRVLAGLVKNINRDMKLFYVGDVDTLAKAASAL